MCPFIRDPSEPLTFSGSSKKIFAKNLSDVVHLEGYYVRHKSYAVLLVQVWASRKDFMLS